MSPEESAEMIYNLLNEALSEDATRRTAAEKALRESEEREDFFASLVQIAVADDNDVTPTVRWLAAVCGKNATLRSWRRNTKKNKVTDDERQFVISTLIQSLGEKHSNIATQLSVWISLISRLDFPRYQYSIISDICSPIRHLLSLSTFDFNNIHIYKHSVITLDMSLKQLCSKRLLSDKNSLQNIGPQTFSLIFELFSINLNQLIVNIKNNQQQQQSQSFDILVYCLKSLRRVISNACTDLSQLSSINQLFIKIEAHPELFLCANNSANEIQLRLSLLVAKLVRTAQQKHPISFQPYLSGFLKLYYNIFITYEPNAFYDRTFTHITSFLNSCFQCISYAITPEVIQKFSEEQQHQPIKQDSNSQLACQQIILSFFNDDVLYTLIQTMIKKIFVLTSIELETWSNDPESLVREEETTVEWGTESLRYECEALFNAILIKHKQKIAPYITNLTKSIPKTEPYLLDACYRVIGKAAADINEIFNFDIWLQESINTTLQSPASTNANDIGSRVLQTRCIWLIGQFVGFLTRDLRIKIYPLIINLMSNIQNDRVITLTCAKTIQYLVDDLGFHSEDFTPYLSTCIKSCFNLITVSSTFETKRDLLDTVSNLVVASESGVIAPVAKLIVSSIPTLWQECINSSPQYQQQQHSTNASSFASTNPEDDNETTNDESFSKSNGNYAVVEGSNGEELLRSSIVTLLTTIIRKTEDATLKPNEETRRIIIAVTEFSIDLRPGMGGCHMLEEGCELWLATTEASTEYNEDLRRIFPQALKILNRDYENLHKIFELIKAYMLLGNQSFMSEYSKGIVQVIESTLGTVRDRGLLAAVDVIDVLLRAFPQEGVHVCSAILKRMIESVIGGNESGVVMGSYMTLIARAALVNVAQMESEIFHGNSTLYVEIMDLLLEHLDSMNRLPRRQVGTLALIGLCGRYLTSNEVVQRIPGVLNCVVQVLSEEKRIRTKKQHKLEKNDYENMISRKGESAESDDAFSIFGPTRSDNPVSSGEKRFKALAQKDTEVCMKVTDACMDLLRKLTESGGDNYSKVLSSTDSQVLSQLEELLKT